MKKLLFSVFTLLVLIHIASAQSGEGVHWISFQEALKLSKDHPKKIYIDVYTKWCGWCKRMDATTFEDEKVISYMNSNFYPVKLDAETKDTLVYQGKPYYYKPEYKSNELAAMMLNGQMAYPTAVYLDEQTNLIGPVPGFLTGEQLLPVLKYFSENIYKTTRWDDYMKTNVK